MAVPASNVNDMISLQEEVMSFWHMRSTVEPAKKPYLKNCVGYFVCLGSGASVSTHTRSQEISAETIAEAETRFNSLASTLLQLEARHMPSFDNRNKAMQATVEGTHNTNIQVQQEFVDAIELGVDLTNQSRADAFSYLGDQLKRECLYERAGDAYERSYRLERDKLSEKLIPSKLKMIIYMYYLHEHQEGLEYTRCIAYGDELLTECSTIFGLDSVEFALAEVFVCGISKSARGLSMEIGHLLGDATSTLAFKLGVDNEFTRSAQEDLRAVRTLLQFRKNEEKEQKARGQLLPRLGLVYGYDVLTRNMEIKLNNADMSAMRAVVAEGDHSRRGEVEFTDFELSYDHPKIDWYVSAEHLKQLEEWQKDDASGSPSKGGGPTANIDKIVRALGGHDHAHVNSQGRNRRGSVILNGGDSVTDDEDEDGGNGGDVPDMDAVLGSPSPSGAGIHRSSSKSCNGGSSGRLTSPVFSLSGRSSHDMPAPTTRGGSGGEEKVSGSGFTRSRAGLTLTPGNRVSPAPRSPGGGMSTDLAAMVREDAKRREKERQEEVREREKESAKERRRLEPLSLESSLSVAEWLQEQGEHDAAREVKQRRLFGRMLLKLDHKGWSELKVPSAGDRAKLMYAVEDYYYRSDLKLKAPPPDMDIGGGSGGSKGSGKSSSNVRGGSATAAVEAGDITGKGRIGSACPGAKLVALCLSVCCCAGGLDPIGPDDEEVRGNNNDDDELESMDSYMEELAKNDPTLLPSYKSSRVAREIGASGDD